jgi:hypothetical protein
VTIVGVVVAVAAIAYYLLAVASALRRIGAGLDQLIGAVGQIPAATEPLEPVLGQINHDLGAARGVLEGLLRAKLGPAATARPLHTPAPARLHYERAAPAAHTDTDPFDAEVAKLLGGDAPAGQSPPSQAEPPEPAPPPQAEPATDDPPTDDPPRRIVYRRSRDE